MEKLIFIQHWNKTKTLNNMPEMSSQAETPMY